MSYQYDDISNSHQKENFSIELKLAVPKWALSIDSSFWLCILNFIYYKCSCEDNAKAFKIAAILVVLTDDSGFQYMDLQSLFQSSYYPFFVSCCYEMEKFRANLCFDTSGESLQTADDSNKVSYFTNAFVLNNSKLVLYFNSNVINNQIRHYLTTIRRNFLKTQYGF